MRPLLLLLCSALTACAGDDKSTTGTTPQDDTGAQDDTGGETSTTTEPYGPDNDWYHAPDASLVPEDAEGTRWSKGEIPPNLHFTDQNGDEVWLYQFYGQQIYVDWVAEWCDPCNTFADYIEPFYEANSDDAVVLTVLLQDEDFNDGDAAAVSRWVAAHGSTNPVLWLDSDQLSEAHDTGSYPNIEMLDPELRMAQTSINTLFDDAWIDQVIDRMGFAIGGDLDNDTEDCDDGIDNDLDLIADCMDDACADDPACAQTEYTGSLSPCTPDPDGLTTTVDVWQVEVRGAVAEVVGDTTSPDTVFESVIYAKTDDMGWDDPRHVGDDEWGCTYEPAYFGCPLGWLRPGTWQLLVKPGNGGLDDGDCVNPDLAEYALRIKGDVTMTLLQDDVEFGDL